MNNSPIAPGLSAPMVPAGTGKMIEKLAYSQDEVAQMVGLSKVTLWRLAKRGLLCPIAGIRSRIYSRVELERFLSTREAP